MDVNGDVDRVVSELGHTDFIQSCVVFGIVSQFHKLHFPEAWQIVQGREHDDENDIQTCSPICAHRPCLQRVTHSNKAFQGHSQCQVH